MEISTVLQQLGYSDSPNYVRGVELASDSQIRHVFRKAVEQCGLDGAYVLRDQQGQINVPVVYICTARDEDEARQIHKRVWNQSVVPFLVVVSPRTLRLYSGFRFEKPQGDTQPGLICELNELQSIGLALDTLSPESINTGRVWSAWGKHVTPEHRVDQKLLNNLFELDAWLRSNGITAEVSHALIGKCVYFKYLRARGILSDRRLKEWELSWDSSFGRSVRLRNFRRLNGKLNEWLNGSVFPISETWIEKLGEARLQTVAGIFSGDTHNQLHLDFEPYDFSFIPVETLSVIYEQFLHTDDSKGESKGEAASAYYTPAPLVSYVVESLDKIMPLRRGMRVIDPSCGSGAFLVECYRKLIERELARVERRLRPSELRDLLTDHIFGIDADQDACRVAEFSLLLTLLDYIQPPDLLHTPNFQLPNLSGGNIIHADAFDETLWANSTAVRSRSYDWVVGNPPWKELRPKRLSPFDVAVHGWITKHRTEAPTGGNQVAEAFAWRALTLLSEGGMACLVMPASSLFKYEARPFRERFFSEASLFAVANFSNLAEVLFGGRSRVPAATMIFSLAKDKPDTVEVFSPLLANQVSQVPSRSRERRDIWSITINSSEIRDVPYRAIRNGSAMPWKLAGWGSHLDARLLATVCKRYDRIGDLEEARVLTISQGLELRDANADEDLDHHPELAGLSILNLTALKRKRRVFAFPSDALKELPAAESYVRKGRFKVPFGVCKAPHIIVGASRTFAIYSDELVIVPARQIGIASDNRDLLKAVALLLNSDFAIYQQVLTSPQYLTKRPVATLSALRELPVPFHAHDDLSHWAELHDRLSHAAGSKKDSLLRELSETVNSAFGLDEIRSSVVEDFVSVRMRLLDGQLGEEAVRTPKDAELRSYAETLQAVLDDFVRSESGDRHSVSVFKGDSFAVTRITYGHRGGTGVLVAALDEQKTRQLSNLQSRAVASSSQWLYFNRNLRIYDGIDTYVFKPLQRFHWLKSQAALDAEDIIAERVGPATA